MGNKEMLPHISHVIQKLVSEVQIYTPVDYLKDQSHGGF